MPSRAWNLRIQDILDAIARIQQATAGMSYEQFEEMDDLVLHGILYNFVIIGEASIDVNDSIKSRYPQISWRLMEDMGNAIAREYFRVNQRLVWNTIQNHLSSVVPMLEMLLQQEMGKSE